MLKNIDKNIKAHENKKNVQSDPSTFVQDSELLNGFLEGFNDEETDKKEDKSILMLSNFIIFSILIALFALLFYNVICHLLSNVWIIRIWLFQEYSWIISIYLANNYDFVKLQLGNLKFWMVKMIWYEIKKDCLLGRKVFVPQRTWNWRLFCESTMS